MAGPAAAVAATRRAVRTCLAGLGGGPAGPVLVACSGGPDSLALAAATAHLTRGPDRVLRAGAVVVDHDLQPGSDGVAAAAAARCRALGLDPVEVVRVQVARDGSGPEAAARTARYAALDEAADRLGAAAVLLGHTREDQAEQVLLGLARGSGARSLAGMAAVRGLYRRPFLGLDRATVRASLLDLGLVAHEDPTNADPATARARVRHRLLPALEAELGPGVAAALARTADLLGEDADALDLAAADLLAAATVGREGADTSERTETGDTGDGGLVLDVRALAGRPAAVRRRALRRALVRAGCPAGALTREHVLAVDALVEGWRGQGPPSLPGGVRAVRSSGMLRLGPLA